ncbi:hypothetical protein ACFL5V_00580 [Fibrobacterota bacterium]
MEQDSYLEVKKEFRKRNNLYAFSSLKGLKNYFRQFMSAAEIESEVTKAHEGFVTRQEASPKETQLQFIKKCEVRLLKKLRKG